MSMFHKDTSIFTQVTACTDGRTDSHPDFNSSCHPDYLYTIYIYIYMNKTIILCSNMLQEYTKTCPIFCLKGHKKSSCGTRGLSRYSYNIAFSINLCNYNYLFILYAVFFFFDINLSYTFWAGWSIRKQIVFFYWINEKLTLFKIFLLS